MSDQENKVAEAMETSQVDTSEAKPEAAETTTSGPAEAENEKPAELDAATDDNTQKPRYSVSNPPPNMLRIKRPEANDKGGNKKKYDPSVLEDSSDPTLIRNQVQFYLSDSNLPTDKFLAELTGLGENKPVPLKTICTFGRMRRYKPYSAVVAALKESDQLIVEGEEGEETVKRKKAFDPAKNLQTDERSVYVKGFGEEYPSLQFDIEAFFAQFGEYKSIRLRRDLKDKNKGFKGSVFVEWADKETAEKFMALDPQPKWKNYDLLILWKRDYEKEKNEDLRNGKIEPSASRNGRGSFKGGRGARDSDNWKERRDRDQKNGFKDRRGGHNQRGRGRGRGNFRGRGRDGNGRRDRDDGNESTGKRAREGDSTDAPPAKKVDVKE